MYYEVKILLLLELNIIFAWVYKTGTFVYKSVCLVKGRVLYLVSTDKLGQWLGPIDQPTTRLTDMGAPICPNTNFACRDITNLDFSQGRDNRTIDLYSITKTRLYNFDPLEPHFYIVKLGFTGVYIIFLISAQNIDCGYSLEPPRHMFWAEIWKNIRFFSLKIYIFWW